MKRISLVSVVTVFCLLAFASSAFAEKWVIYSKDDKAKTLQAYDADMAYVRDQQGVTPYVQVRLKLVRGTKVVIDRLFMVDPDVTMIQPMRKSGKLMAAAFEDWARFHPSDFRLVEAIKQWKRTH